MPGGGVLSGGLPEQSCHISGSATKSKKCRSVRSARDTPRFAARSAPATGGVIREMAMSVDSSEEADEDMGMGSFEDEADDVPASVPSASHDPLHAIVAMQSFNGSFSLNQAFATAIGISLAALENEIKSKGWDSGAFATALAIVYLETKMADLKESWELVAAKARKWLEKNHAGKHGEIMGGATAFLAAWK